MAEIVKVWEEDILLPTYGIGKPEKNPMFLEKRVYQGSSGVVYPYPVIEKIEDTCEDKSYHAVYLENEYIKVMILQNWADGYRWRTTRSSNVISFITIM